MNDMRILIVVPLLAVLLASCGASKQIAAIPSQDGIESEIQIETDWDASPYNPATVAESIPEWTDLTASGDIVIDASGKLKSAFQMKMVRGKSVSFSLRPFLGIEMGKIYIDCDSVTIVDKYHNLYVKDAIASFLGSGISIDNLQSLLLARPFDLQTGSLSSENLTDFEASAADGDGLWTLFARNVADSFSYFFDMHENRINAFNVELNSGQLYALRFSEYRTTDKGAIAGKISANIPLAGMDISFELRFGKSVKWDNGITDRISIPKDARRYSLPLILKALSKQ